MSVTEPLGKAAPFLIASVCSASWFSLSLPGSAFSPFPPRSVTLSSSSFPEPMFYETQVLKSHAGISLLFEGKLLFLPEQTASFFLRHRALSLPCCECRGLAVSSLLGSGHSFLQDALWSTSVGDRSLPASSSAASSSVRVCWVEGKLRGVIEEAAQLGPGLQAASLCSFLPGMPSSALPLISAVLVRFHPSESRLFLCDPSLSS